MHSVDTLCLPWTTVPYALQPSILSPNRSALRIASHGAFVRDAGPLPIVTGNILESFDSQRAASALDLTAELGSRGQAIVFYHHVHLLEMARPNQWCAGD